jgi:PPOX class probable FMN-dependent enzyme
MPANWARRLGQNRVVDGSGAIETVEELRAFYRSPSPGAINKVIDRLDDHCRTFIRHSPFLVLATAAADGRCDVSPKGGPPGFVRVVDEHRLAWADMAGNNRLDSMQNLVSNQGVAILFLIPGLDETLRVNGEAVISTDPDLLELCRLESRTPHVVITVEVAEAYIHCAKALRRAELWDHNSWPDLAEMPSVACMLRDHVGARNVNPDEIAAALEVDYARTLWEPGGGT